MTAADTKDRAPQGGGQCFLLTAKQLQDGSPSHKDGVDPDTEAVMRRNYCDLLQRSGYLLKIPQPTIATAVVFCHRYFAVKSMKRNDRFVVATACLFLACKVEECMRRVNKVLETCYSIRYNMELPAVRDAFGNNQEVFDALRENVLIAERALLYTLGFNFRIEKPYQHITQRALRFNSLDPEGLKFLTQIAWNFVNDSLQTTLLLQHAPKDIAYGAIFLAAKFLAIELPEEDGKKWYEQDGVQLSDISIISSKLMDTCERSAARIQARSQQQQQQSKPQEQQVEPQSSHHEAAPHQSTKRETGGALADAPAAKRHHGEAPAVSPFAALTP